MPSALLAPALSLLPLHRTFGAEVQGMQWKDPIPESVIQEIKAAVHKYGVLIFRNAKLDNDQHIRFSRHFGDLDDVKAHTKAGRVQRFPDQPEIFDLSNLDEHGNLLTNPNSMRVAAAKGNYLWHADMAYNPRRCSYSILRSVQLPPKGTGGETEFLDTRTAFADLPQEKQAELEALVTNNSLYHQRKLAAPKEFANVQPLAFPMSRHRLVSLHEQSGRKNLYVTTYAHHFDGKSMEESQPLIEELLAWISKPKYKLAVTWENDGDLLMWDNRAVIHRATVGGSYGMTHKRDMRRTTVRDSGMSAYGENGVGACWQAGMS
ncbi:alpha-ketoglutarate-dependent 2,4-dichlorophenoxyacetate dioxygenase [Microdochium nivale]|nr:alpha-ketoglutarate-dependent 2,4-dichlorophenoxyacetate dioxygenase [Microdochium nivale]